MHLIFSVEAGSTKPVYKQMSDAICKAIDDGELLEGQLLPSISELADCMSVSRVNASRCYEELTSQGYVTSHNRKNYVSRPIDFSLEIPSDSLTEMGVGKSNELSDFGQRLSCDEDEFIDLTSSFGATPQSHLPISRFQECLYEAVRDISIWSRQAVPDSFGLLELREQLQALILRSRGIQCSPEQIIVFPSTEGGLDLLCRLTLRADDLVATEDPGFSGIRRSFEINGATVLPIPLDSEGIRIDLLADLERVPRLIYLTPSTQDTTGVTMSRLRRRRLLQWVISNDSLIVEDDIGSEFNYGQEPQPALFSQDSSSSVIYRYNFWKSLYPLVKLSFMVIPESFIPLFRNATNTILPEIPQFEQVALAAFIRKGHYESHLQKCRNAYAIKRASLIQALNKISGAVVKFSQQAGGTHLTVQFSPELTEPAIELAAELSGIDIWPTQANYALTAPPINEYLVSFSNIDEAEIERQIYEFVRLTHPEQMFAPAFTSGSLSQLSESLFDISLTV
jgi:GntR family transcriptional regulator / MocR family aminotransferase